MEVGPEVQAGSQGRVGGHASEWGPEELAAEALVAPCARPPPSGLGAPPPPLSRGTVCGVHLCALGADMEPAPRRYQCMSLALEQKPGAGVDVPE